MQKCFIEVSPGALFARYSANNDANDMGNIRAQLDLCMSANRELLHLVRPLRRPVLLQHRCMLVRYQTPEVRDHMSLMLMFRVCLICNDIETVSTETLWELGYPPMVHQCYHHCKSRS